ncbi:MAG: Nif3-like dinuclear metal center hexameric protein [Flavobacteriaceae bacterium]|nr:Nif3-like dinuclear metal center hexameric protein [Flavobacteriaceae bacterium]
MTIKEITNYLEELAPLSQAEDFDNVGLLIGNAKTKVTGILVTLDALEKTVDEAIANHCNLIVSFHPIIFKALKKLNGDSYVERVAIKAIKNNIAIYTMHTALDNSFYGVSAKMCAVLGLENRKILIPKENNPKIGMGMIATLPTEMTEKDFLNLVALKFHAKGVRHSNFTHQKIKKVALLGGSGAFAIANAKAKNADAYISADFNYHDFFKAEDKLLLIDIGHYESEQFTKSLLVDYLNKKISNFATYSPAGRIILSGKNTNPINYLLNNG